MRPLVYGIFFPSARLLYIGSSWRYLLRWTRHISDLRRGVHHCARLQAAFDRHGEFALRLVPLELLPVEATASQVAHAEQRWIARYVAKVGRESVLNRQTRPRSGSFRNLGSPARCVDGGSSTARFADARVSR